MSVHISPKQPKKKKQDGKTIGLGGKNLTFVERFPFIEPAHEGVIVIGGTLDISDVHAGRETRLTHTHTQSE